LIQKMVGGSKGAWEGPGKKKVPKNQEKRKVGRGERCFPRKKGFFKGPSSSWEKQNTKKSRWARRKSTGKRNDTEGSMGTRKMS